MGRRPKPLKLHLMQGTFDPRQHGGVPDAMGVPAKPGDLGRWGSREWDRVIDFVVDRAGGGECDQGVLAGMCRWYNEWRRIDAALQKVGPTNQKAYRLLTMATVAWRQYTAAAAKFGLTPVDRMRIHQSPEKQPDALDDLTKKHG